MYMDKKSAELLKKMCAILEIVRWSCLISEVLLIGLFLIFVSDKGIYNTIFGSIRIDYLQLIFKNDLALNKDKMSGWLPLLFLGIAFLVFIIYKSVKTVEEICSFTINQSPFDKRVSNYITRLAQYIVAGGIVFNILDVCRIIYFKQIINFDVLLNTDYVTQIDFAFHPKISFLIVAALIYLLSFIFRYGQELQRLSDETL